MVDAPSARRLPLTSLIRFNRITIMTDKIKTTNPYSGQSEMLTPEEHKVYMQIERSCSMRKRELRFRILILILCYLTPILVVFILPEV